MFLFSGPGQMRRQGEKTKEDKPSNQSSRNIRGMTPGTNLKSRVSELPFSSFWEIILRNSEHYKTIYKSRTF